MSEQRSLRVLALPGSGNAYTGPLYRAIEDLDASVTISDFDLTSAWSKRADVVHVHWPERTTAQRSRARSLVKVVVLLTTLALLRRRGARIVWTCHNLVSHERYHPRLEDAMRRRFLRLLDGVIHLSDPAADEAVLAYPILADLPSLTTLIGTDRVEPERQMTGADARAALDIAEGDPILSAVGRLRPYKRVPELVRAFRGMHRPARLLIAGACSDNELRAEIEEAAAGDPRVLLRIGWLDDAAFDAAVSAADLVVLPYRRVHNSAVAVDAIALGRPVAAPLAGSIRDVASWVGDEWVRALDADPGSADLDDALAWAIGPRSPVDRTRWSQREVARETLAFYRTLVRRPTSRGRRQPAMGLGTGRMASRWPTQ